MKKTYDFLKQAGTFYVATLEGVKPRVRPFGFVMICKGRLYFCTNSRKRVYEQLLANDHVELCACVGPEWIRISGRAVFDEDMDVKKQVFLEDPGMKALYQPDDPIFKIFYLEKASVTFSSMDGKSETRNL